MQGEVIKLSFYVLTYNSEKYIDRILSMVAAVADEVIVVDSGSTDNTREIVKRYTDLFYTHSFIDFPSQRAFAVDRCSHEWVFYLDSDEVPDDKLIEGIGKLKRHGFYESDHDAYTIVRHWYAMGKKIHVIYPSSSPDYPIRIFKKSTAVYKKKRVHEGVINFDRVGNVDDGHIDHYTFETPQEFEDKLHRYTDLAAIDALMLGKKGGLPTAVTHGMAAFIKWYFIKGGYKDGLLGLTIGKYAFLYTYYKYIKLKQIQSVPNESQSIT